jgi:hypothetical protein
LLVDWLVGWPADQSTDRPTPTDRLAGQPVGRPAYHRPTDRSTD